MRRCPKCGSTDVVASRCRPCRKKYLAAWYKRNAKKHRKANRAARIQHKYGISLATYEEMLKQQQGRCAICGTAPRKTAPSLAVDHNHQTGAVRGLLCLLCNTSLERVELAGWLTSATMYLNRYSGAE